MSATFETKELVKRGIETLKSAKVFEELKDFEAQADFIKIINLELIGQLMKGILSLGDENIVEAFRDFINRVEVEVC